MTIDLTDEETATLLKELDNIIASDRYFLSPRIRTLQAIRAKIGLHTCSVAKPRMV